MSKVMRKTGLVTILLFLAIAGALSLGWAGDTQAAEQDGSINVIGTQALELRGESDMPRVPSERDGMFVDVEKSGVPVGEMDGAKVTRFDDWERGISCYRMYNLISCASMATKVYELRQTGLRF